MNGLKSFLFFNDLGQLEVSQYLGISKVQMSRMVSGTAPLRHDQLLKLVSNDNGWNTEFLTDPVWAELEADGKRMSTEGPALAMRMLKRDDAGGKDGNALPLIPFDAVAGPGSPVYEDERAESYYSVSEFKDCDFMIRVKGDSMSPKFTGGDLLACRQRHILPAVEPGVRDPDPEPGRHGEEGHAVREGRLHQVRVREHEVRPVRRAHGRRRVGGPGQRIDIPGVAWTH